MNANQTRLMIEELRRAAAQALASTDNVMRERARGYLRMIEVQKVRLLAMGENVAVTSREGRTYGRAV